MREAGFTTVYTQPGSGNIIGGTGIAIKLWGHTAEEMMIPGTEEMKFALGENPKRFHGLEQHRDALDENGNRGASSGDAL